MGRQIWLVFFGPPRTEAAGEAPESPAVMMVPLGILAVLSVFGGLINFPGIHPLTDWLEHTIEHLHAAEFNLGVAALSTVLALLAILVSWMIYGRNPLQAGQEDPLRRILGPLFVAMERKWWVDELYWTLFLNPYIVLARFLADTIDWRFWHDWFHDVIIGAAYRGLASLLALRIDLGFIDAIANGLGDGTISLAGVLRRIQTGFVRNYALGVFIGVVLIMGYLILR